MPNFKPGELVQLKAGGPKMVVERSNSYNGVTYDCTWFAGAKHNSESFREEALQAWEEED